MPLIVLNSQLVLQDMMKATIKHLKILQNWRKYIKIIDKENNTTWSTIYEVTHETYFKEVTLFIDKFL